MNGVPRERVKVVDHTARENGQGGVLSDSFTLHCIVKGKWSLEFQVEESGKITLDPC